MGLPLARYTPSRLYLSLTLFAACAAFFSAWMGLRWTPCWIAALMFSISAVVLGLITFRPPIEIHETHLRVGRMVIPWTEVQRVDQTGWTVPLAVHLALLGDHQLMLLYPGDADSSSSLLRHLRRFSREALLDGVPYREFWGEPPATAAKNAMQPVAELPVRYPLLRPEDEDEVERMFHRLKSVGHLESKNSEDK